MAGRYGLTFVLVGAFLKRIGLGAFKLLSHASAWQLIAMVCALAAAGEYVSARHCHKVADRELDDLIKVEKQRDAFKSAISLLAGESKQQQQATTKTIDHYITVTKPGLIRERVKIETAPLPGNCKTPDAVLQADL